MGHALTIALHSIDEHHQEEEEEATSITQFNEEVVYSYLFLEHLHVNCKDILNLHKHALYNQTGNYFITFIEFCEMFQIDGSDKKKVMQTQIFFNAIRNRDLILDTRSRNKQQNERQYASIFVIYLSLIILSTSDTFEMKCKTIFDLFNFDKRYVYITPASLNIMIATMVQTISSLVYQQIDKLIIPLEDIKNDVENILTNNKMLYQNKFAYHEFQMLVVNDCPENIKRILEISPYLSSENRIKLERKMEINIAPHQNLEMRFAR